MRRMSALQIKPWNGVSLKQIAVGRRIFHRRKAVMTIKRTVAGLLVSIGLLATGSALAGTLETNLSGWFAKGTHAEISVTGLNNSGFNFRLSAGNITPGEGCANGPANCLSLWGWATRTDVADEFLYANEDGQCVFYMRNEPAAIVIHGLKGTCGTTEENRNALRSIDGVYMPRQ